MGAFIRLLERWGFVKLDDFGLILTPDRRIAATRGPVLADGQGTRIVGWRQGDLAAFELPAWTPDAVPTRAAIPEPPRQRTPPSTPPPVPARPRAVAAPAFVPRPPPPAAEPPEEEWEWQIAMARANAIAQEVEAARPPQPLEAEDWETQIAAARVRATAAVDFVEEADTIAVPPRELALVRNLGPAPQPRASAQLAAQSGSMARTVIPVPRLPAASDPSAVARSVPAPRRMPDPRRSLRVASRR
jgi:hypothetical protein